MERTAKVLWLSLLKYFFGVGLFSSRRYVLAPGRESGLQRKNVCF